MILKTREGKQVEVDFEFNRYVEDSFICSATYLDSDDDVPEEVMDELNEDNTDIIQEEWNEHQIGAADALLDSLMDK